MRRYRCLLPRSRRRATAAATVSTTRDADAARGAATEPAAWTRCGPGGAGGQPPALPRVPRARGGIAPHGRRHPAGGLRRCTRARRHGASEDRAFASAAAERETPEGDAELRETVCACIRGLVETLKPEYATALRRVDLDGERVDAFAREAGITASNASARLHRARAALRGRVLESCRTCAKHGCRDCECGEPRRPRPGRDEASLPVR